MIINGDTFHRRKHKACLEPLLHAIHFNALLLCLPFHYFQGKMMGMQHLWRTQNSFNIVLTKGDLHRWIIRQMDLHCFSDDSFVECCSVPPQWQYKIFKHSFDYVADWKINHHDWAPKKKKKNVCTRWKLCYSSVARAERSLHWSAFRWKTFGKQSN